MTSLRQALSTPEDKRRYVRRLFATIAPRYDLITRLLSFGLDQRWKRRLLALVGPLEGRRLLDLACGTGDIALAAASAGARVAGLDVTPGMIALARTRAGSGGPAWMVGDMVGLPVATGSIDLVTTGYGLRNVPDLAAALTEAHRVLRSGGVLGSLDFNRPESAVVRTVYLAWLTVVGATLGWLLHGDSATYRYIPASIRRYPGASGVAAAMRDAGFADVRVAPVLGGLMTIHVARKGTGLT